MLGVTPFGSRLQPRRPVRMAAVAATALTLAFLLGVGAALNFDLPPGQEECFYEEVHAGMFGRGAWGGGRSVCDGGQHARGWRRRLCQKQSAWRGANTVCSHRVVTPFVPSFPVEYKRVSHHAGHVRVV